MFSVGIPLGLLKSTTGKMETLGNLISVISTFHPIIFIGVFMIMKPMQTSTSLHEACARNREYDTDTVQCIHCHSACVRPSLFFNFFGGGRTKKLQFPVFVSISITDKASVGNCKLTVLTVRRNEPDCSVMLPPCIKCLCVFLWAPVDSTV